MNKKIEITDSINIYNKVRDLQRVPITKYNKKWASTKDILKILYDGGKDATEICNTIRKELENSEVAFDEKGIENKVI